MCNSCDQESVNVSRETLQKQLGLFVGLVRKWNPAINLISRSSINSLETRHVADSLQLLELAPQNVSRWVDIGSGGGFPGVIVAIGLSNSAQKSEVHLVESDLRKATFLREVARQLGLNVSVHAQRIETIPPLNADVLSARALAPLAALCEFASVHLKEDGLAIFPKGESYRSEIELAHKTWDFDIEVVPSRTEPSAAVLLLRNIRHVA